MIAGVFIILLSAHFSIPLEGMVVDMHATWPYMWPATAKQMSDVTTQWAPATAKQMSDVTTQWASATAKQMSDVTTPRAWSQILTQKTMNGPVNCPSKSMPAKTPPNDGVKNIAIKNLMNAFVAKPAQPARGQSNASYQTRFPESYGNGIGISAGRPPQNWDATDEARDYKEKNKLKWQQTFGDAEGVVAATQNLRARLAADKASNKINNFFEVLGIYEQCEETSFIVDLPSGTEKHTYGNELREAYAQDTYMWFDPRVKMDDYQKLWEKCGKDGEWDPPADSVDPEGLPTSELYYRPIGLGWGGEASIPPVQLGNMCQFQLSARDPTQFPYACSIDLQTGTLWADTNAAYPLYDAQKDC